MDVSQMLKIPFKYSSFRGRFGAWLALPLLASACPCASALLHVACRMHPLASPAPRLRARAPSRCPGAGPFCACLHSLLHGEHSLHELLHCCAMPAHRPVRKQCSRPIRPHVSDAAGLAHRCWAYLLLLLRAGLPMVANGAQGADMRAG